jgi:hypothetical protein
VFKAASDLLDRDERSSKRRKLTVRNFHDIVTPEMLAQAAFVAKEIRGYAERKEDQPRIAEDTIDTSALQSPDTDWE